MLDVTVILITSPTPQTSCFIETLHTRQKHGLPPILCFCLFPPLPREHYGVAAFYVSGTLQAINFKAPGQVVEPKKISTVPLWTESVTTAVVIVMDE